MIIIDKYIREQLEDIEDADIALARSKKPNRKLYSSSDVQKFLGARDNTKSQN